MTKCELFQKEKPIMFTQQEVIATLENRKTAKRIAVNPQPWLSYKTGRYIWSKTMEEMVGENELKHKLVTSPFSPYKKGDILYVKETWQSPTKDWYDASYFMYKADWKPYDTTDEAGFSITIDVKKWRSSTVMPKAAARLFLEVTDVSVCRLQEMREENAELEGFSETIDESKFRTSALLNFKEHWTVCVNSKKIKARKKVAQLWSQNPWVHCIKFRKINIE